MATLEVKEVNFWPTDIFQVAQAVFLGTGTATKSRSSVLLKVHKPCEEKVVFPSTGLVFSMCLPMLWPNPTYFTHLTFSGLKTEFLIADRHLD